MAKQAVGVDVTVHKEERDVADARRKTRVRARYYVELVVGSRHADHTRLGFSGTFKALLSLHQAFARAYLDKYGEGAASGAADSRASVESTHRRASASASSSSSSTASQSSVSSASSSTMKRFFKQAFAFHSTGRRSSDSRSELALGAQSSGNQLHRARLSASSVPSLPPFPAQHKVLVRLEGDGSKDDVKIEARAAALFEYYSQVFNSEDGELYVELIQQHATLAAERKRQSLSEDAPDTEDPAARNSSGLFKQLLTHRSRNGDALASGNKVEFLEPVYVRNSRSHKSAKRSSTAKGRSNQRVH